jgi:hypothetical protein
MAFRAASAVALLVPIALCSCGGRTSLADGDPHCAFYPGSQAAPPPGCMKAQEPPAPRTDVSPRELVPYRRGGGATLQGQAFLRRRNGDVVTCAGALVRLVPAVESEAVDYPRRCQACRATRCDAQGHFGFAHLPAREWIVVTRVEWEVLGERQGGPLSRPVALHAGRNQVLLTR